MKEKFETISPLEAQALIILGMMDYSDWVTDHRNEFIVGMRYPGGFLPYYTEEYALSHGIETEYIGDR